MNCSLERYTGWNGESILDDSYLYKSIAEDALEEKKDMCGGYSGEVNQEAYIMKLWQNIYYFANTSIRYGILLRKMLPYNILSNRECVSTVDEIQKLARDEVNKSLLWKPNHDMVVSEATLEAASNLFSMTDKIIALECIYAQMSVENNVLIDTIDIVSDSETRLMIKMNYSYENDSGEIMDYYFSILKQAIKTYSDRYPMICG